MSDKIETTLIKTINTVAFFILGIYFLDFIMAFWNAYTVCNSLQSISKLLIGLVVICEIICLGYRKCKGLWTNSKSSDLFALLDNRGYKILFAYLIWSIICVIFRFFLDEGNWILMNEDSFFEIVFVVAVLFPMGYYYSHNKIPRYALTFLKIIMCILIVLCTGMLVEVFQLNEIHTAYGGIIRMDVDRLVINLNSNTCGIYAMLMMYICIVLILCVKSLLRIVYIWGSVVFYFVMALSGCRSAFISMLICFCLFFTIFIYKKARNNSKNTLFRNIFFTGIIVLVIIFILIVLWRLPFYIIELMTKLKGESLVKAKIRDMSIASGSGRFDVWANAIKCSTLSWRYFILGYTSAGTIGIMDAMSGGVHVCNTHNQFLETLLAYGFVGLVLFVGFLIYIFPKCLYVFSDKQKLGMHETIVPYVLLSCIIVNIFETNLIFFHFLMGLFFAVLSGWVCGYDKYKKHTV